MATKRHKKQKNGGDAVNRTADRKLLLCLLCFFVAFFNAARGTIADEAGRCERNQYGAIVRGDASKKQLALVFTGDEFGEGATTILDALAARKIHASFFLTGRFLQQESLRPAVKRMIAAGHYVGPHSDAHLLYCDWANRDTSLVSRAEFAADLRRNIERLREFGACRAGGPIYFIPPYEWYNRDQVAWCRELSEAAKLPKDWLRSSPMVLVNFTQGTRSQRDYAPEGDKAFVPSQRIYDDILKYEQSATNGLNGHILLLHLGSGRHDAFHPRVGQLCDELTRRAYKVARIDELLKTAS